VDGPKYTRPLLSYVAQWADGLDEDAREWFEERAAIYEYEAGMPRARAELAAKAATERLLASRSPLPTPPEKDPKNRK
jgi:hypothetical protein